MLKRSTRAAVAALLGAILVSVFATSAFGHVEVSPSDAPQAAFTKLAFSVPNEQANAATNKVELNFPIDHPLLSVSVKPHVGWTYTVDKAQLPQTIQSEGTSVSEVVSKITWTASSAATAIKPGEFDEFEVSAGPLPKDTTKLVFKVLQTYDNGDIVRWIDDTPAGGPEPDHPAPVLALTGGGATGASVRGIRVVEPDSGAETLLIVALIALAVIILVAIILIVRRTRRGEPPAAKAAAAAAPHSGE